MAVTHEKRRKIGDTMKYEQTVSLVNKILSEYTMKLTLRQIYYRLVADYGLANKRSSYNSLSSQLVKARERGHVNENRIEDRTRTFLGGESGFDNPEQFIEAVKEWFLSYWKKYDKELWNDQDQFVIVWVEKDALSRVLSDVADTYRVITAPSRGYASFTYIRDALRKLPRDKPVTILHFADHDSSGLDMTRDIQRRFRRYGGRNVTVERVALTYEQVQEYGLTPNPTKLTDPRAMSYISQYGRECWELDAIEPSELQNLVLNAIENHVDLDQWENSKAQMEEEREALEETFEKWRKALDKIE